MHTSNQIAHEKEDASFLLSQLFVIYLRHKTVLEGKATFTIWLETGLALVSRAHRTLLVSGRRMLMSCAL